MSPHSRLTIFVNELATRVPQLDASDLSAVVTSTNGVPIVVETARYGSPSRELWGTGAAMLATRIR